MAGRGDDRRLLTLEVARRHYKEGWSKKLIGERLSLSRFQVARMLDRALANGWVRIEIQEPADLDPDLGARVRQAFDLRYVLTTIAEEQDDPTRQQIATAAAQFLEEALSPHDVLGLAWSRTVAAMVERLRDVPRVPVVQLNGALPQSEAAGGSVEMVRRFASLSGGPAYLYYAPMILTDADAAATLRAQPDIRRTLGMAREATVAVVAIGAWTPGASTVYDALNPAERRAATRMGVVAEISGLFIDADGRPVDTDLAPRLLCPRAEDLAQVDHVIAVAHGAQRGAAVDAALRSGLITSLVCDAGLARSVLAEVVPEEPTEEVSRRADAGDPDVAHDAEA